MATRSQAEYLFNLAWHAARGGRNQQGVALRDDPKALADHIWRTAKNDPQYTYQAARGAAVQAARALANAEAMRNDPLNRQAVLNADMARNPGIDRRRGQYEYRVIATGRQGTLEFETLVFVRSNVKLTHQEVIDRANQAFRRAEGPLQQYRARINALGANYKPQAYLMGVSHHP